MSKRLASWVLAIAAVATLPSMAACSSDGGAGTNASSETTASTIPVMLDGLYVNQSANAAPYSQISFIGYLGRYIAERSPCANPDDGSCHEQGSFYAGGDGHLTLSDDATQRVTTLPFAITGTMQVKAFAAEDDGDDTSATTSADDQYIVLADGGLCDIDTTDGGAAGCGAPDSGAATPILGTPDAMAPAPSSGSGAIVADAGDLYNNLTAIVNLINQILLGEAGYVLIHDGNGLPVSSSNPPATPPVTINLGFGGGSAGGSSGGSLVSGSGSSGSSGGSVGSGSGTSLVGSGASTGTPASGSGTSGSNAGSGAAAMPSASTPSSGGSLVSAQKGSGKIDPNHIMDDSDLTGGQGITPDKIQSILTSKQSALATYTEGGQTAAQIIVTNSKANGINPMYMIARIEGESSLVGSRTLRNIKAATGCGCPDGHACDPNKASFPTQVTCAAKLMQKYMSSLNSGGKTVSGWAMSQKKETLDPCAVTPDNKATAAIYTYTPWVGTYSSGSCGALGKGGSTLMGTLMNRFKSL